MPSKKNLKAVRQKRGQSIQLIDFLRADVEPSQDNQQPPRDNQQPLQDSQPSQWGNQDNQQPLRNNQQPPRDHWQTWRNNQQPLQGNQQPLRYNRPTWRDSQQTQQGPKQPLLGNQQTLQNNQQVLQNSQQPTQSKYKHLQSQFVPISTQIFTSTSATSNISPIISQNSSVAITRNESTPTAAIDNRSQYEQHIVAQTTNKLVSFKATDEDFPAVGTIRKKPKHAPAAVSAQIATNPVGKISTNPAAVATSAVDVQPSCSQRDDGLLLPPLPSPVNNQELVGQWLQSVQPPDIAMQSQQPPLLQHVTSSSAPAAQQMMSPMLMTTSINPDVSTVNHGQPVIISNMVMPMPVMQPMPEASFVAASHSGNSATALLPVPSNDHNLILTRNAQRQERRPRNHNWKDHRGLPTSLPSTFSGNVDDDPAFVQQLHQAVDANKSPSQYQSNTQSDNLLDVIANRSTLNWNAKEFCPSQQTSNSIVTQVSNNSTQHSAPAKGPGWSLISERRRRQRFNRTLKPNALFELLALPTDEQLGSQAAGDKQAQARMQPPKPTYNISAHYSGVTAAISPRTAAPNNNNELSQSVFRLASLHKTGIGTCSGSSRSSCNSRHSCNTRRSCNSWNSPVNQSLSTIAGRSPESTIETGDRWDLELTSSPTLLNMDTPTHSGQMTTFFEAGEHNNLAIEVLEEQEEQDVDEERDVDKDQDVDVDVDVDVDLDVDVVVPVITDNKALPRHILFMADDRRSIPFDANLMPPSVEKLHRLICGKYSDYAFVYALSAQLSQHCVPMECYVYVKMALLCSLVSIEPDELRAPISICIICSDCCVAHRLLQSVGQLAQRFIGPHEGGQQATHTALPVRFNWLQASPLLLAQLGVYYAGDWNRLTRDQSDELEKCIENGSVAVPQLQSEQPLEAAIWTYWQPENASNQSTAFAKLSPIFGLPVYMDEQMNDVFYNFVLRQHSIDAPELAQDALHISNEDMQTMLGLLHQRQVEFTEKAQQLLQKYFVVSRIEQPSAAFSSKTYIVLKQFAESIAKLAMRLNVLEADVVVAIFHCEIYVRNIFGAGDNPPPAVAHFNVISRLDSYMNEFTRWLYQYLDHYEDDISVESKNLKRKRCESNN